jgi:dTDP-4-amino-4,6-dideoxygalactose transaminase
MMKVEFYRHHLTEEDRQEVASVLQSTFLTTGPVTASFERSFARYTGLPYVVGVNSCTSALHLSLLALGIGPGDEVITTPMTFIASATCILHAGATPVLADVEEETGLIDPEAVEAKITPRTKAILPVHLYGTMADMKGLRRIADRHGLFLVEDSAHCVEGERDGVRPGQLGDAVCYSFYATKNLACGEGGAVAVHSKELAERLTRLRTHGMSADAAARYSGLYRHWDMVELGWKCNLHDVSAALLIRQIDRLENNLQKREQLAGIYDRAFDSVPGVDRPAVVGRSARHLYTLWVDERDEVLHRLQRLGVGVAVNYRSIHTLTFFKERFGFKPDDFPRALKIGNRTITLPLYSGLSDQEAAYVTQAVRSAVLDREPEDES